MNQLLSIVPKNEQNLLEYHYEDILLIFIKLNSKYFKNYLLIEQQDLTTLTYLFLKEIWSNALSRNDIKNFRAFLVGSCIKWFFNYSRKISISFFDHIEYNERKFLDVSIKTPEDYAKYNESINLFIKKFRDKVVNIEPNEIFEVITKSKNSNKIWRMRNISKSKRKYLLRKSKKIAKEIKINFF